ncbi:MAG: hypothetical protein QM728_00395 [Gordonia sp. (in: high G+C Gram-positive bacteria)]|uniref:hypothetical protein n=1 Tax=Gordonia sp. (in: high G+C Gram-positive bacteria) TaxID=84139 RepID=UPI0039E5EC8B
MKRIPAALVALAAGAAIAAAAPQAVADPAPAPAPANCKLYPECLWNEEGSTWPGVESTTTGNDDDEHANHEGHDH